MPEKERCPVTLHRGSHLPNFGKRSLQSAPFRRGEGRDEPTQVGPTISMALKEDVTPRQNQAIVISEKGRKKRERDYLRY